MESTRQIRFATALRQFPAGGRLSDRGIAYEFPEVIWFLLFRSLALIEQVEDCGLQIAKVRCFHLSGYCLQGENYRRLGESPRNDRNPCSDIDKSPVNWSRSASVEFRSMVKSRASVFSNSPSCESESVVMMIF